MACLRIAGALVAVLVAVVAWRVHLILELQPEFRPADLTDRPLQLPASLVFHRVPVAPDVELNVLTCGAADGELVIFLHGFPETALTGWHHQLEVFCAPGTKYRVVAPDMRGYNTSSKPSWVWSYRIQTLGNDIKELLKWTGKSQANIVAHDWGGAVAWYLVTTEPSMFKRFAVLNMPHVGVFGDTLRSSFEQFRKSWYVFYFQIPYFPELRLTKEHFRFLLSIFSHPPQVYSRQEVDLLLQGWSEENAITSMVNYYRASLRYGIFSPVPQTPIHMPFLMIWGDKDIALSTPMAAKSAALATNGRLVYLDSGHFVQHEKPAQVTALLDEFLSRSL